MRLYHHIRSSASYRVRIALALKGISYESRIVDLLKDEQSSPAYISLNPSGLVPMLEDGEFALAQSMAIIEYLDETYPEPAFLPSQLAERARVRAVSQAIACDIHPLNNLRVLQRLKQTAGFTEQDCQAWARHWIALGFDSLEIILAESSCRGAFCFGEKPGLADVCLVPQMVNAARVGLDLTPYPTLRSIEAACMALPAFSETHPARWNTPASTP